MFVALAAGYLLQGAFGGAEFPFVANSTAKDGLMAVLCFIAAGDVRRNGWAALCVIGAHVIIVASLLFMLFFGDTSSVAGSFQAPPGFELPSPTVLLWIWLALAIGVIVLLAALYHSAARARYGLRYLHPHQHRTAMALAEVLVMGDEELMTPEEVAGGIDDYLASFSARQKGTFRLALSALTVYPLARLRPPYPLMSPQRRFEFIEHCFIRDVAERRLPEPLRRRIQSMLFAAHQLTFIGYYADPRTARETGYVPFSKRKRYAKALKRVDQDRPRLNVRTPGEVDTDQLNADVVIVGSGAAGAVLAHRLAKRGREVVLLEGGRHIDPRDFTEDERVQFSNLFSDGGMQLSRDARFQVLQGKCVGGSTVINNAVCFDLPGPALERWNDPDGLDAGLDEARLAKSFSRLRGWLPVQSQANGHLEPGASKFVDGVKRLGLDRTGNFDVVDANISDCLGCGYCNIGCAYGKKLSALDNILPRAQRKFGDAVRIFSECTAERIETSNGRATAVRCRLSDGRQLRVAANTVVVSAGAIASSLLLQRSHLGGSQVGQTLCFNLGAPLTGDFEERLDSYDGLQISHFLQPAGDDQLILETWFNPVGAQALMMPGWFRDHFKNMRRYSHLTCIGSVVGTQRNGRVKPGFRGRGMKLDYVPTELDLRHQLTGTKLAGRILLAAGARRVMPLTFRFHSFTEPEQLDDLDAFVHDNSDIQLHSSHPQGGNPISRDPAKGVVDERFSLHGAENLYVCDASVFPAAITVNPQLTVMALADYAAAGIE